MMREEEEKKKRPKRTNENQPPANKRPRGVKKVPGDRMGGRRLNPALVHFNVDELHFRNEGLNLLLQAIDLDAKIVECVLAEVSE